MGTMKRYGETDQDLNAFFRFGLANYGLSSGDAPKKGSGYNLGLGLSYSVSKYVNCTLLYTRHTAKLTNKSEKIAGTLGIGISIKLKTQPRQQAKSSSENDAAQQQEENDGNILLF
ncbi:MAG: hypothetical protein J5706_00870 [Elusimicrobiales bacterium]|nr:hypothetical protein [Elusimicrobiales bacterium]